MLHYFFVKARKLRFTLWLVLWAFMFIMYYCLFLIGQSFLMISNAIYLNTLHGPLDNTYLILEFVPLGIQYLCLLIALTTNSHSVKLIESIGGPENISPLRNIIHFLLSPIVLFLYGCVAFYGITEVAIRGKEVCKHGASKKEGLVIEKKEEQGNIHHHN